MSPTGAESMNPCSNRNPEFFPYLGIRFQIRYYTCNLDCPYCIASWRKRPSPFDFDTFRKIIAKIKELPYRVCLRIGIGGEIFTSKPILSEIRKICNEDSNIFGVSFSSNIHASYDRIIEPFLDSVDTARLGMGCTLHDMVIPDVDAFFEKVEKIRDKGVLLYVGNVAVPGRIDSLRKYKQRCDELGIPFILNALIGRPILSSKDRSTKKGWRWGVNWGRFGLSYPTYPRDYTFDEIEQLKDIWFTRHSWELLVNSASTKGMRCSAGKNYIHIDHQGNVFPCLGIKNRISNIFMPVLRKRDFMGNILSDPIRFRSEDRHCPRYHCWCGNENQALRIVDKHYHRTRTLRIFHLKEGTSTEDLEKEYNPSIYRNWRRVVHQIEHFRGRPKNKTVENEDR